VKDAADARWAPNPEKKRLGKKAMQEWAQRCITGMKDPDVLHATTATKTLRLRDGAAHGKPPFVIVTGSEEDIAFVQSLCAELLAVNVNVSSTLRTSGPALDTVQAIDNCSSLIGIVSKYSILSDRMRSEVYRAISTGKTVICVVVGNVTVLPDSWKYLKRIVWEVRRVRASINQLLTVLPGSAKRALGCFMQNDHDAVRIKQLLCQYPEWLPIEEYMCGRYHFHKDARVPRHGTIDLLAARPDTGGVRAYLYYFGSPRWDYGSDRGGSQHERDVLVKRILN
jgi:hypothetical protein